MKWLAVVPFYNCQDFIAGTVESFKSQNLQVFDEVWLIDNHSQDKSLQMAQAAIESHPQKEKFRLIANNMNLGLGGSFKKAVKMAREQNFTHFCFYHGDGQASLTDLPRFQKAFAKNPRLAAALGSRFSWGSKRQNYSGLRYLGNIGFNILFSLFTGHWISDIGSGLNIYALTSLGNESIEALSNHIAFDAELLLSLIEHKNQILFVPISWRDDGQISTVKNWQVGLVVLKILWRWRFSLRERIDAEKIQIFILMAGKGERFASQSSRPKPFLKLADQELYLWAQKSLQSLFYRLVPIQLVTQKKFESWVQKADLERCVFLDDFTSGPVESAMQALQNGYSPTEPLILMDCDLAFESDALKKFLNSNERSHFDGALLSFFSDAERFSYVRSDADGLALAVAEKQVISNQAIAGCYYFSQAALFMTVAKNKNYISEVYAELIRQGKKIKVLPTSEFESFGTPQELQIAAEKKKLEILW